MTIDEYIETVARGTKIRLPEWKKDDFVFWDQGNQRWYDERDKEWEGTSPCFFIDKAVLNKLEVYKGKSKYEKLCKALGLNEYNIELLKDAIKEIAKEYIEDEN